MTMDISSKIYILHGQHWSSYIKLARDNEAD